MFSFTPRKLPTYVCCVKEEIIYKPLVTSQNNPQITKAMRYSQYIKNPQNSKTVFFK
jgi:hypothetical protein